MLLGYVSGMGAASAVTVESPWGEPGNEAVTLCGMLPY